MQYRCQKYFEEEFFKYKGVKYYWEGVDAGNMKMLLRKLKKAYLDIHGLEPTDDELGMFFKGFINSLVIFKPDKFVDEKFTIKDINSQFNVVYPKLLNAENGKPRQQQQQTGPTDEYLRRVAAEVEANGGLAF